MNRCPLPRKPAPYGLGDAMCDREFQAWLDELEEIAPPCVTGFGRAGCHNRRGRFVDGLAVCGFCGRPFGGGKPHWDYSHLLAALDFAEPWTIARAS